MAYISLNEDASSKNRNTARDHLANLTGVTDKKQKDELWRQFVTTFTCARLPYYTNTNNQKRDSFAYATMVVDLVMQDRDTNPQGNVLDTPERASDFDDCMKLVMTHHIEKYMDGGVFSPSSVQQIIDDNMEEVERIRQEELDAVKDNEYSNKNGYKVVQIDSYEEAQEYGQYTEWCVTHYENMWDKYTRKGLGRFYFFLKEGFEDVDEEKGEDAPLDEYGLSMIAVSITQTGYVNTITCRWNHDYGGSDKVMEPKELAKIVDMDITKVCKPYTKEELIEKGRIVDFDKIVDNLNTKGHHDNDVVYNLTDRLNVLFIAKGRNDERFYVLYDERDKMVVSDVIVEGGEDGEYDEYAEDSDFGILESCENLYADRYIQLNFWENGYNLFDIYTYEVMFDKYSRKGVIPWQDDIYFLIGEESAYGEYADVTTGKCLEMPKGYVATNWGDADRMREYLLVSRNIGDGDFLLNFIDRYCNLMFEEDFCQFRYFGEDDHFVSITWDDNDDYDGWVTYDVDLDETKDVWLKKIHLSKNCYAVKNKNGEYFLRDQDGCILEGSYANIIKLYRSDDESCDYCVVKYHDETFNIVDLQNQCEIFEGRIKNFDCCGDYVVVEDVKGRGNIFDQIQGKLVTNRWSQEQIKDAGDQYKALGGYYVFVNGGVERYLNPDDMTFLPQGDGIVGVAKIYAEDYMRNRGHYKSEGYYKMMDNGLYIMRDAQGDNYLYHKKKRVFDEPVRDVVGFPGSCDNQVYVAFKDGAINYYDIYTHKVAFRERVSIMMPQKYYRYAGTDPEVPIACFLQREDGKYNMMRTIREHLYDKHHYSTATSYQIQIANDSWYEDARCMTEKGTFIVEARNADGTTDIWCTDVGKKVLDNLTDYYICVDDRSRIYIWAQKKGYKEYQMYIVNIDTQRDYLNVNRCDKFVKDIYLWITGVEPSGNKYIITDYKGNTYQWDIKNPYKLQAYSKNTNECVSTNGISERLVRRISQVVCDAINEELRPRTGMVGNLSFRKMSKRL